MRFPWLKKRAKPEPSNEAQQHQSEIEALRPRVEAAVRERRRLLEENNYTARIRALYQEGRA